MMLYPPALHRSTLALFLALLALVVLLPSTAMAQPALGEASGCRLVESADREATAERIRATAEPGVFTWQSRPGDRLACDLPGFEPLDTSCAAGCPPEEREIRLLPARTVELRTTGTEDGAEPLALEWRRFGGWQEPSELLAVRRLETPGPIAIPLARDDDRLLRIRRGKVSPRTFYLRAGEELPPLELGPLPAGGEVLGFLEAGPYLPKDLKLVPGPAEQGEGARLEQGAFGRFGAVGLPADEYTLVAVYEGGLEVPGPTVVVRAGRATELLPWGPEPVGALEVSLDDELCTSAAPVSADRSTGESWRVEVVRRGPSGGHLDVGQVLAGWDIDGAGGCSRTLEGVEPGSYEVSLLLRSADGRGGDDELPIVQESVRVQSDELAWTRLERRTVVLAGVVGLGPDRPLADLVLEARAGGRDDRAGKREGRDRAGGPWVRTTTDAAGQYRLSLPKTGVFTVRLLASGSFPILEKEIRVKEGENPHDFDLGDAGLWVRIERADGAVTEDPVRVEIRSPGEIMPRHSGLLDPGEMEILLYDLQFERYEVRAFSESGWTSEERPVVELSKSSPLGQVELVLVESRAVLSVRDTAGRAVSGLKVALDQHPLVESDRLGDYPLVGAAEGSEIRILPPPDYVPVCRRLERLESMEIVLETADSEAILVPPRGRMPNPGAMIGMIENLPGSDCPMPISILWRPGTDENGQGLIRIPGLSAGVYRFRSIQGEQLELQVPGPPVPLGGSAPAGPGILSKPDGP